MSIPPEWFMRAVEVAPCGIGCVTPEGVFEYLNEAYAAPLGYSAAHMTGRTWMEFTHSDDIGFDLKAMEDLRAGKGIRGSYSLLKRYIHRDGHYVGYKLTVIGVFHDNNLTRLIVFANPATNAVQDVQEIEREIRSEMDSLKTQLESIQDGIEFRKRIVEGIKKHWALIAGILTLTATAVWNIAKDKK